MKDALFIGLIFVGTLLAIIAFLSWILHYFVALNSPPTKRAAWTVGIPFLITSIVWFFASSESERWEGPLAAIPAALIAFAFWRDDFRRDWIDDSQGIPEGVELTNSDWRIGLLGIAMLIAFAALKAVIRKASMAQ